MAKKQTRRSISVSRTTYERLKAFCEANNVSMSQFVESRVGDFLSNGEGQLPPGLTPRAAPPISRPTAVAPRPELTRPSSPPGVPMTSQAARFAVEQPPPIIK